MFDKHVNNKELSAEASTLRWPALQSPRMFTLVSEWTGRAIVVQLVRTETDNEGDILSWTYKPINKYSTIHISVEVFND